MTWLATIFRICAYPCNPWLIAFLGLALVTPVWAHSSLDHSEPKNGAVLKEAPAEIRLWFAEPIKAGLSTIEVRDASERQVDKRDLRVDEKTPALVHLSLVTALAPGSYTVTWSAVAQDLHVGKGHLTFRLLP
jgi:methionine-rich copper-binding protein CopC